MESSDPLRVAALALRRDGRVRLLLANLTPRSQRVRVPVQGDPLTVRTLDETSAEAAMREPEAFREREGEPAVAMNGTIELELRPYAVARLDTGA